MALQASGTITIADIAAEFGGSAPHSLSEYYRGGGLVPDIPANSSVPTSGAISLSNFYGATAVTPDYTPDAVNWNNISGSYTVGTELDTNTQTITGINETITIRFARSTSAGALAVWKNGSSAGVVPSGGNVEINFVSGDTIFFRWTVPNGVANPTVTITNQSDGGATLDTFTINTTGSF